MKNFIFTIGCLSGFLCLFGSILAMGENFPARIKKPVDDSISIRQKSQKAEDKWARERARLTVEYERLEEQIGRLSADNQKLNKAVAAHRSSVNDLEREIREIGRITKEFNPFLEQTYIRLARFVKDDVPFLREERTRRMARLRQVLDDPNVSVSEKFRRLMEALSVEAQYGNTVEVYQKKIMIDNKEVLANIFRLGRISLFFQTLDLESVGYFDPAASKWKKLPPRYKHDINAAMEMGAKRRPVDLLDLPLGKVVAK